MHKQIKSLNQQISSYKSQISKMEDDHKIELEEAKKQILTNSENGENELLDELQQKNDELTEENRRLNSEIRHLKEEKDSPKSQQKDDQKLQQQVQQLQSQLLEKVEEIKKLKEPENDSIHKFEQLSADYEKLQNQDNENRNKIKTLQICEHINLNMSFES